jgi:hypothetical protein
MSIRRGRKRKGEIKGAEKCSVEKVWGRERNRKEENQTIYSAVLTLEQVHSYVSFSYQML